MTVVLTAGGVLLAAGLRSGDRPGETVASNADVDPLTNTVRFTVHNPGSQAVLVGASVRRRSLRLVVETGYHVSVPRRTDRESFGAGRYDAVGTVQAGDRELVAVPIPATIGRRGELVVAIGEQDRLRIVRRAVALPHPSDRNKPSLDDSQQRERVP